MIQKQKFIIYADPNIEKIMPQFLHAQENALKNLKLALENGDFNKLARLGHTMRGSCGGYGFHLLGELGKAIENAAQSNNINLVEKNIRLMEEHLDSVEVVYKKS